jgi:hypothetical protein
MKILYCYSWVGDGSDNLKLNEAFYCFGQKSFNKHNPSFLVYRLGGSKLKPSLQYGYMDIVQPDEKWALSDENGDFDRYIGFKEDYSYLPREEDMPELLRYIFKSIFNVEDTYPQQRLWHDWYNKETI